MTGEEAIRTQTRREAEHRVNIKTVPQKPRIEASEETNLTDALTLDLQPLALWEKYLLLQHPVWDAVSWRPQQSPKPP